MPPPYYDYVCVSGYGWSGSSAVVDLLHEFKSCYLPPAEFRVVKDPYGLDDLYYSTVVKGSPEGSVDFAVKDFISYMKFLNQTPSRFRPGFNYRKLLGQSFENATREFISSLVNFEYLNSWWMFDFKMDRSEWLIRRITGMIINKLMKLLHVRYRFNSKTSEGKSYFVNVSKEKFLELSRKYIDDIFTPLISQSTASHVILDQAVPLLNYENEMNFFREPKLIVVDRDPRDIYANLIELNFWFGKDFAKTRDVNKFITMHKASRINRQQLKKDSSVLLLRFEDLIYNYEESIKRVIEFIGLKHDDHTNKREFFDPDISINNVGMWRRVITESEANVIVSDLEDYCYSVV